MEFPGADNRTIHCLIVRAFRRNFPPDRLLWELSGRMRPLANRPDNGIVRGVHQSPNRPDNWISPGGSPATGTPGQCIVRAIHQSGYPGQCIVRKSDCLDCQYFYMPPPEGGEPQRACLPALLGDVGGEEAEHGR